MEEGLGVRMIEANPGGHVGDGINMVELALNCIRRWVDLWVLSAQEVAQSDATVGAAAGGILQRPLPKLTTLLPDSGYLVSAAR